MLPDPNLKFFVNGNAAGDATVLSPWRKINSPLFIGRKLKGRVSGRTQVWFGTGLGALIMLPFAASSVPTAVSQLPLLIPTGVLSLGIPYLLIFLSLNHVSAQTASIGMLAEPVSGVMIGKRVHSI